MENVKIYYTFNRLCLLYHDLTIEYNKIYSDNQRCLYFKDQYPNVYQEFMKFLSIVPCKENKNLLAKYVKPIDGKCYLIKLMEENNINNLYNEPEYINTYKRLVEFFTYLNDVMFSGTPIESLARIPILSIYIYLKLLTQKLENTSDSEKKYLLNYILYLLKNNKSFRSFELSNNSALLEKYKSLPEINELETNKYYQIVYNINYINYGGSITDMFNICPLHLTDIQEKNISLNKVNIDSNQISRGINKKLLSDKNNINAQYLREENDSYIISTITKKYIVGDKIDYDYINNKMLEIMNKYKINNKFNLDLMIEKLYEEIIDTHTKIPSKESNGRYTSYILYDSVFIVDKEIDRKYFDGKLSYFAKLIISMLSNYSPNDKICSEYILSNVINGKLGKNKEQGASLYMMIKYMEDQFNTWLDKIKPLLGLDDEWNYDETKDTIRNKVIKNDPQLIEKYDQLMNINYLKIYTLDPLLDNYDKYNILKTFGKSFEFLISKILSIEIYKDLGSYSITDKESGRSITIDEILTNIKDDNEKSTYLNNEFINNYGFKKYFTEMMKDFKNENSVKIYEKLEDFLHRSQIFTHPINRLTDGGTDYFFNDYTYEFTQLYNNCSQCMEELYKLNTEGFYKTFEEINTLKQYQELKNTKNTTTKENKKITKSVEISWDKIFDKENNGYKLKVNLNPIGDPGEYYYTVDTYYNTTVTLKTGSDVVVINDNDTSDNKNDDTYTRTIISQDNDEKKIELKFKNHFTEGSIFKEDAINKMKFYKTISVKSEDLKSGDTFISTNNSYVYTIVDNKAMYYDQKFTILTDKNIQDTSVNNNIDKNKLSQSVTNSILYTKDISDSEYIGEYLITKEDNYAYPINDKNKLEKLIFHGDNNKYILYYAEATLPSIEQYYVKAFVNKSYFAINKKGEKIQLFNDNTITPHPNLNKYSKLITKIKIGTYTYSTFITHIEGAKFEYGDGNELEEYSYTRSDKVRYTSYNDTGYILFDNKLSDEASTPNIVLLVITNEEKFRQYITRNIYPARFDYNQSGLYAYMNGNNIENITSLNLFLILNKPKITYAPSDIEMGIPLDNNLVVYGWKYNINNVNTITLKNNIYKEEMDLIEGQHLQKEFIVQDFNKLMLRKCFPDNFKRTLLCNQDVLDAIDGSKYAIPNIKIKEALCEYGKYPYYLEHYFMTSRVDYKLKGKFNLRCIANLAGLPDTVLKYLDKDDLNYTNKEIIIQGKDMIVKDGKIISKGDVYLVGIELANDHMFKIPPTKILNKALLNVIDFQQFDNIYDRVELYFDNLEIKDYIVKQLRLENIGTLKNMKYINFY